MTDINTLDEFRAACVRHDLTYGYSDDYRAHQYGRDSEDRIRKAAQNFPREDVKRIWDEVVDTKLKEGYREPFYWRWPAMNEGRT